MFAASWAGLVASRVDNPLFPALFAETVLAFFGDYRLAVGVGLQANSTRLGAIGLKSGLSNGPVFNTLREILTPRYVITSLLCCASECCVDIAKQLRGSHRRSISSIQLIGKSDELSSVAIVSSSQIVRSAGSK
jgi:hypothetical protein